MVMRGDATDEGIYEALTKEEQGGGGTAMGGLPEGPGTQEPPPQQAAASAASAAGKIQDNSYFRTLDREVQKFVEQSGDPWGTLQGIQSGTIAPPGGAKGGAPAQPGPITPPPAASGAPVAGPPAPKAKPVTPAPGPTSHGVESARLGEGVTSDTPGTFTRPGQRAFQGFQGRVFGQDLKDVGANTSAADVLASLARRTGYNVGGHGRVPVSGVAGGIQTAGEALGGLGAGTDDDPLIQAVLNQQGLG
jgi:hypothetical protein